MLLHGLIEKRKLSTEEVDDIENYCPINQRNQFIEIEDLKSVVKGFAAYQNVKINNKAMAKKIMAGIHPFLFTTERMAINSGMSRFDFNWIYKKWSLSVHAIITNLTMGTNISNGFRTDDEENEIIRCIDILQNMLVTATINMGNMMDRFSK